jgi:mannitol/fructose-specific phosphotransferase system IIA component (Ntr-type)
MGRRFRFALALPATFGRNGTRKHRDMDLSDILGPDQILPEMKATNRWEAIDELIDRLITSSKVKPENREAITAVVKKRETSMSTGIGFGIGIPHASTDLIYEVVGALGRSRKGVNFDALDNQPVNLVMLFLVPQGQFQKHLHSPGSPSCFTGRNFVRPSKPRRMPRRCSTSSRRNQASDFRRLHPSRFDPNQPIRFGKTTSCSSFNALTFQPI